MTLEEKAKDLVLDGLPQILDADEREALVIRTINRMSPVELLTLMSEALEALVATNKGD